MYLNQGVADGDRAHVIHRQRARLLDSVLQRLPFQVLHDDVDRPVFQKHVMNCHNVWGIESGNGACLLQYLFPLHPEIRLSLFRHQHTGAAAHGILGKKLLDGNHPLEVPMRPLVRDSESPFPQDPAQGEPSVLQVGACRQIAGRSRRSSPADGTLARTVCCKWNRWWNSWGWFPAARIARLHGSTCPGM